MAILHNERIDVLNMTEHLGVVRKMKTKARITGLATLSSLVLQEAYSQVGLPACGSYYVPVTQTQDSIFGMLVLVGREFELVDESTVDVIMSWEHFMDGDNQEMAIKDSSAPFTGRNKLYGKTRTSVQQTKVNFYWDFDPGIRAWPKNGDAIASSVRTGTFLGGFTRVGGDYSKGNCVFHNGFYWVALRDIFIGPNQTNNGGTIAVDGVVENGHPIRMRPDPEPGPRPLSASVTTWPVGDLTPYRDPVTRITYPNNLDVNGSTIIVFPGHRVSPAPYSTPNAELIANGGWPWRLALSESESVIDWIQAEIDSGVVRARRIADFTFPDSGNRIRIPIACAHQFPLTDRQFKGQTFYQTGEVSVMQPHKTYTVQGVIYTTDNVAIEDAIIGKVNIKKWMGGEARMWMCSEACSEAIFTNKKYKFRFEFQKNPDTWFPTAVFNDQRTGRPPCNLVPGFGTRADLPTQDELDFDAFFMAQFEDQL